MAYRTPGIGLVFAALLQAVARNPSLRGQLFSYAILGFAFVEAIGVSNYLISDSPDISLTLKNSSSTSWLP